jgi:hypothetical protein
VFSSLIRPLTKPAGAKVGLWARIGAGCIAGMVLGVLGTAAWLRADPAGHGTHTQLGMPQCTWAAAFNVPCPTCGMTTAFSHVAHGEFVAGFWAQPLGSVLALAAAAGFWGAVHVAVTGSQLGAYSARMLRPRVLWGLAGAAAAAWAYKYATWPTIH